MVQSLPSEDAPRLCSHSGLPSDTEMRYDGGLELCVKSGDLPLNYYQ